MLKRTLLSCALLLALSTASFGQLKYETSLTPQEGFHLATQDEFLAALKYKTGAVINSHTVANGLDKSHITTTLFTPNASTNASLTRSILKTS